MLKAKKIFLLDILLVFIIVLFFLFIKAPTPVNGLEADSTYDTVRLSWEKDDNATSYLVYRSEDGENYDFLSITPDVSFKDENLTTGQEYTYKVKACNIIKWSKDNNIDVTPSLEIPKIKGDVSSGKAALTISEIKGAEGYNIYRDGRKIGSTSKLSFIDKTARTDTAHKYQVKAYRGEAESAPSDEKELTLVSAGKISISPGTTELILSWDGDYPSYKLFQDDKLLTETSENEYILKGEEGTYTFKLIGYNDGMQSPETIQKFKISQTPMNNEVAINKAVDWAVEIANDDSFTYGTGKRAHRHGCYFCGNNLKIKGSSLVNGHSYKKTYCCNPYVSAAYAHGAGDEALLKACKAGHGIAMSKHSFTRYGNWKCVGKPAYKDLKKGDVLVKSNHVAMYIGDGKFVQAGPEGWGAKSIAVSSFTAKKYKRFSFVMRYTGNGSGTMFSAEEL